MDWYDVDFLSGWGDVWDTVDKYDGLIRLVYVTTEDDTTKSGLLSLITPFPKKNLENKHQIRRGWPDMRNKKYTTYRYKAFKYPNISIFLKRKHISIEKKVAKGSQGDMPKKKEWP